MKPKTVLHLALLAVAVLFSLNYIFGKIALRHFSPFAFAWVRVAGSALVLALWVRRGSNPWSGFTGAIRKQLILYAILGVTVNQLLFITGLSMTTAHEAAILITTIPIFTLGAAAALGRELLTARKALGIVVAMAGALSIVGIGRLSGDPRVLMGDVLILVNCFSYSLYLVLSKPLSAQIAPARLVASIFAIGTLLMLPFSAWSLLTTRWTSIPAEGWLALGAVIAGPTVGAYILNAWALGQAESSTVAIYSYLQPLIATLLATMVLDEVIKPSIAMGAAMIFAGVYWVSVGKPVAGSR